MKVLCGGTRDEKIRAIFDMFDPGEGRAITYKDLRTYFTSAFRVMYKLHEGLEDKARPDHHAFLWL